MIWLTWRQHRTEIAIMLGLYAAIAVGLLFTGIAMHNDFQQLGIASCVNNPSLTESCGTLINIFDQDWGGAQSLIPWLNLVPALFGVLIGVPLIAREYEQGTQRLAWTQSITRLRWLLVKLGVLLAIVLALSAVLIAIMTWWNQSFDFLNGRFPATSFDFEGIVPLGYAAFSFAMGTLAGAIARRSIPAVAATIVSYVPIRLFVDQSLRQNYMSPLQATFAFDATTNAPSRFDWLLEQHVVDQHGQPVSGFVVFTTCRLSGTKSVFMQCVANHGWLNQVIYQPASRFWPFQGIEFALFFGVALALLGLTVWLVNARTS